MAMALASIKSTTILSSRRRAELWVSGARTAQEVPGGESRADALATLFRHAGIPERGKEALRLLHDILVDEIDLLLQLRDQEEAHRTASRAFERYLALFECAPVPYVSLDIEGRIVTANRAAATLFERNSEELMGTPLAHLFADSDGESLWHWARSIDSTSSPHRHCAARRLANRRGRCVHATASRIEASHLTLLMLTDVSDLTASDALEGAGRSAIRSR